VNKSKIEWCDYTWNPVTGCYHGCKYCYARRIAERFGGNDLGMNCGIAPGCQKDNKCLHCEDYSQIDKIHQLEEPQYIYNPKRITPYPYAFEPTFHQYRLEEPLKKTKPSKIFVCSMADLFGEWVPDEWIEEVFKACDRVSQHIYIFLTKNPVRYAELAHKKILRDKQNFWYGTTRTNSFTSSFVKPKGDAMKYKTFYSIEPLLEEWEYNPYGWFNSVQWVIIGAMTGPEAIKPKKRWVQSLITQCRQADVPIFLKDNLEWHEKIQEFPTN